MRTARSYKDLYFLGGGVLSRGVVSGVVVVLSGGGGGIVLSREGEVDRTTTPQDHVTSSPVSYPMMHLVSPPKCDRMTDACENITFARFATRAVIKKI